MSTVGRREPLRAYWRRRNLDLNVPASEISNQDEPYVNCGTQGGQENQQAQRGQTVQPSVLGGTREEQANQNGQRVQSLLLNHQGQNIPTAIIDVEAFDDDVIESSSRAFAEAKRKRNRRMVNVVVPEADERASWPAHNRRSRGRRAPEKPVVIVNLESDSASVAKPPPPLPPPPKEITFNCPICMGPLVEEMSTRCGHIFCKFCIKTAIAAQAKCPTCRKRVTVRELIRVFLPAAS